MKQIIIITLMLIIALSSCDKYLDQVPQEILTEKAVWESKDNAVKVLTQAYSGVMLPPDCFRQCIGPNGGEAAYIWSDWDAYRFDTNNYSQNSNIYAVWSNLYSYIRTCHYFLDNIDKCKDSKLSEQDRTWWKAEATYLMAYYYFLLLEEYGPVPIIDTKNYSGNALVTAVNNGTPRPTLDEMVSYIDNLLVEAASKLDISWRTSNSARIGRANASAAKFLRARLWTYAASPLYNGLINPSTKEAFPQLMIKDNKGKNLLSNTADAAKWAKAVEACKDAIATAITGGHKLITGQKTGYDNYKLNFTTAGYTPNVENIYFWQIIGWVNNYLVKQSLPLSWSGYSGICPTQEHVDEYFTSSGLMLKDDAHRPDPNGFYEYTTSENFHVRIQNQFTKRDPRLYCNILFPGQCSYTMLDGTTEATNRYWSNNPTRSKNWYQPWVDGQDGFSAKSGRDYTINGYLLAKWIPNDVDNQSAVQSVITIFRYAELLLNLIESAFESDVAKGSDPLSDPDIFNNWDMLRDRVGLPHVKDAYAAAGIPLTVNKLRELIHNERRVELAFEGHRYFDNRRWLEARSIEEGPKHGFAIQSTQANGFWNKTEYTRLVFFDKKYFVPIPQDETTTNSAMTQNPLW